MDTSIDVRLVRHFEFFLVFAFFCSFRSTTIECASIIKLTPDQLCLITANHIDANLLISLYLSLANTLQEIYDPLLLAVKTS